MEGNPTKRNQSLAERNFASPEKESEKHEEAPEELQSKLERLEEETERTKKEINEIRVKLGLPELDEVSTQKESLGSDREGHLRDTVKKVQDMFIGAADTFLEKDSPVRAQIIKFYSDPERLFKELSNVFRGVEPEEIDARVAEVEEKLKNESFFLREVLSKDFSTSE
ncbi:MAG: hypothetical protein KGH56_01450 [Patescibacteria group bacterium]|nr:hypothetical protein [Patescibacteria group bacterium]